MSSNNNHIVGFDHCVLLLRDLQAAFRDYERLGFRVSTKNTHPDAGTANHVVVFRREYLELLTIEQETPSSAPMAQLLNTCGDGLRMLSLRTSDAAGVKARLDAGGVGSFGPFSFSRKSKLADGGEVDVMFTLTVPQPVGSPFDAHVFACQPGNPELVYEPDAPPHPNGATGMISIDVPNSDLAIAAERLSILMGEDCFTRTDTMIELRSGTIPIRFIAQPAWRGGEATAIIRFASADMDQTRRWMADNGVECSDDGAALAVKSTMACTATLTFQPA